MNTLPCPRPQGSLGHLPRWYAEPLSLLQEGAALAGERRLFGLQLGVGAVVGFSPEWNKKLLTDLDTFRSAGSLSRLVPHLSGGVILTDAPEHSGRRRTLNPGFTLSKMEQLVDTLRGAMPSLPPQFDALAWADWAVMRLLNAAYFSGEFNGDLLHRFLSPLRRPFPAPMSPQPLTRRQVDAEVYRVGRLRTGTPRPDILTFLLGVEGGLTEARISLAAAHDTTTHALAYALWYAARYAQWHTPEHHPALLKEVLRLYPPGWMGSRRVSRDLVWEGVHIPRGTLALYSPYLSGRDPYLWERPADFQPARWAHKPPAWAYLPFGGGERTCLGMHLAQTLILMVLGQTAPLQLRWGNPAPQPGLTLGPVGPLWLEHMRDLKYD